MAVPVPPVTVGLHQGMRAWQWGHPDGTKVHFLSLHPMGLPQAPVGLWILPPWRNLKGSFPPEAPAPPQGARLCFWGEPVDWLFQFFLFERVVFFFFVDYPLPILWHVKTPENQRQPGTWSLSPPLFIWCLSDVYLLSHSRDLILFWPGGDNWLPVSTTDKPSPCGMWGFSFCPQRSHTPSEVSSHVVSQGASTTCTPQIHQPARAEQNSRLINLPAIMRPRSTSLWDKTTSASCCRRGIFFPLSSLPFSFFSFYSLFFSLFELQKWQEGKIWDCPGWSFSTAWLHCSDWETWTTAGTHAGVLGKKLGEKTPPQ